MGIKRHKPEEIVASCVRLAALTADIVELAKAYGRYGYRRITALLRHAGGAGQGSGDA